MTAPPWVLQVYEHTWPVEAQDTSYRIHIGC
jgi:hypothetical protein